MPRKMNKTPIRIIEASKYEYSFLRSKFSELAWVINVVLLVEEKVQTRIDVELAIVKAARK